MIQVYLIMTAKRTVAGLRIAPASAAKLKSKLRVWCRIEHTC